MSIDSLSLAINMPAIYRDKYFALVIHFTLGSKQYRMEIVNYIYIYSFIMIFIG